MPLGRLRYLNMLRAVRKVDLGGDDAVGAIKKLVIGVVKGVIDGQVGK